uniref:Vitamin K-dependent gamma-carboxylase lumenal domain-containing protein n=1 Tax=Proboscia inermis TaxID=420281 RepID=A0A7S0CH18_9STRA
MSQRIGYSFPAAMISTSFLFRQMHAQDMSHAQWLQGQLSFSTSVKSLKKRRRYILPLLWLLVQWALPLRMPFVSDFNFKYTREGYRWSWTMMLHGSNSAVRAGMTFLTMRPTCNQQPFPNPHANRGPHMDIHSFPYEMLLPMRVSQVVQLFPRQLPKIADKIYDVVQQMCRAGNTTVTISYFSSVNGGAYHRLIDPTADLASIHRVHSTLSYAEKLWLSLKDKPPKGHEFILRGIGTSSLAGDIMNGGWQLVMVDRISCLAVDPIRIHSVALDIEVVETSFPLTLTACEDLELNKCIKTTLTVLNPVSIPPHRTLFIGVDKERMSNNNLSCSNSVKEDVVIRLRNLNSAMPESRPGYEKVRK